MKIKCFMVEKLEEGWKRLDSGEILQNLVPGAMYYAPWLEGVADKWYKIENGVKVKIPAPWSPGPDGRVLIVITPGGSWNIDSRSSNCTRPEDDIHKCWCRHGIPPEITVDKNGDTCIAGAGSIQCGNYHGFLRDGYLVDT